MVTLFKKPTQTAGFTLIELLVAAAITVVLMLAVSSMFITSINTATKTHARQVVKSEGAYVVNQISFFLRNSISLDSCSANSITVTNSDGGSTVFRINGSSIASGSGLMTSSSVSASGLTFTCNTSSTTGEKYVMVDFTLTKGDISEPFSSVILLRN